MKMTLGLLAATMLLTTASAAIANDLQLTGVISAKVGGLTAEWDGFVDSGHIWWKGTTGLGFASVSGSIGVVVAPNVTMQVDGWLEYINGGYDGNNTEGPYSWAANEVVVGSLLHLTYHSGDYLIGIVGGMGQFAYNENDRNGSERHDYQSTYAVIGLEAGYDVDNFRLLGQIATSLPTAGDDADDNELTFSAHLAATYYSTPNLAFTGSVSVNKVHDTDYTPYVDLETNIGAEVRYKLDDSPFILSLAYNATFHREADEEHFGYDETSHRVQVGLSVPFGANSGTLRDLDRAAGLKFNPPYVYAY